jgi:hypothetical protein
MLQQARNTTRERQDRPVNGVKGRLRTSKPAPAKAIDR